MWRNSLFLPQQYKFNVMENWHVFLYFLYKSIPTIIRTVDAKETLSNLWCDEIDIYFPCFEQQLYLEKNTITMVPYHHNYVDKLVTLPTRSRQNYDIFVWQIYIFLPLRDVIIVPMLTHYCHIIIYMID